MKGFRLIGWKLFDMEKSYNGGVKTQEGTDLYVNKFQCS